METSVTASEVTVTNDGGWVLETSAHLLSRALVSQSASVTCCTLARFIKYSFTWSVKQMLKWQYTTLPKLKNVLLKRAIWALEVCKELLARATSQFVFVSLSLRALALVPVGHFNKFQRIQRTFSALCYNIFLVTFGIITSKYLDFTKRWCNPDALFIIENYNVTNSVPLSLKHSVFVFLLWTHIVFICSFVFPVTFPLWVVLLLSIKFKNL
jgi:hypothetical protein